MSQDPYTDSDRLDRIAEALERIAVALEPQDVTPSVGTIDTADVARAVRRPRAPACICGTALGRQLACARHAKGSPWATKGTA